MRRFTRAVAAALLSSTVFAGAAHGAVRLNQYEVTLRPGDYEVLAQAGYDLTEGRDGNRVTIVATAKRAAALAKQGVQPRKTSALARDAIADNYGPSGGYTVWRPYNRTAYDESGAVVPNLVQELQQIAADNPGFVKLVKIGTTAGGPNAPGAADDDYVQPKPIWALKVSKNARSEPDGSKPAVVYSSTQHAREWLATETNRRLMRLFVDNYGKTGTAIGTDGLPVAGVTRASLTQLVNTRELWFVLVCNPDGYDYTFESPDTRLWRKNLRDNDANGVLSALDGVDPNRNFPTQWGYDDEGSSSAPVSETYRGPSAASEPETKALDGLFNLVNPTFNNNFHTAAELLLYSPSFQVDTTAADDPLFRALAGSDENPAIEGFNPGIGAELYITNGDTNEHAYETYGTLSFTPEGTPGDPDAEEGAGGFVFQDIDADVQQEFEIQLPFSLDMARSADDPSEPESHLGNVPPDFEVDSFNVSFGSPQTVQVSAKRSLGPVTANWQIGNGPLQSAPTTEWAGGERYGINDDVYYHRLRASIPNAVPGDKVKVWFTANGGTDDFAKSQTFTYTQESDSNDPVLIIVGENYSGPVPAYADPTKPAYLGAYTKALDQLGVRYDVWDVDGRGLKAPDPLGVLSHYQAMIFYTGDDVVTRAPGQPGQTGALKVANDTVVAMRDRLNEGGKLLVTGQESGAQFFTPYEFAQFGEPVNTPTGYCAGDPDVADSCVPLSNDFFQYYLGGYYYAENGGSDGENAFPVKGLGDFGAFAWSFAADSQPLAGTALVTSSILDPAKYPQFKSEGLAEYQRPGAAPYDPFAGDWYLYSGLSDSTYRRLTRTIDLTGKTGGKIDFQASFDTEAGYDFMFVEAHTPGQDDWTTLAVTDDQGNPVSDPDTGFSCGGDGYTWQDIHPFLAHYQTFIDFDTPCESSGTTGDWNGITGSSGGWEHLNVDLSTYNNKKVQVSISFAQDGAAAGLGVFIDELRTSAGATELSKTGFETDLGGWTVAGPPPGSDPNTDDWTRTQAAFDESPVIGTADTVWMTFGLEGVDTDANRNALLATTLKRFGVATAATPTPTPTATATASPTASPTVTPQPPRRGTIRIGAGPVRAKRNGKAPIGIKCVRATGPTCTGTLVLSRAGKTVGRKPFRVKAGVKKKIGVPLSAAFVVRLERKHELRVKAVATATSGGYALLRGVQRVGIRRAKIGR